MDENPEDDPDAIKERILAIFWQMKQRRISPAQAESLLREERRKLHRKVLGSERAAFLEFVERLLNRQGSILPDFDALYARKSQLDEKLFADDTS